MRTARQSQKKTCDRPNSTPHTSSWGGVMGHLQGELLRKQNSHEKSYADIPLKVSTSVPIQFVPCIMHTVTHDDVIKWKHFPCYWPFVRGNHRSPVNSLPVTRSFNVFFDLRLNKPLSKQSRGWWLETLSRSLWRRCNAFLLWLDSGRSYPYSSRLKR